MCFSSRSYSTINKKTCMKKNLVKLRKIVKKKSHLFLIILLAVTTSCYVIYPVLRGGWPGVFFSIDPDTHYIGNSLSFIKINQIQYTNHPATPSINRYLF